jgi:hypothetical protein
VVDATTCPANAVSCHGICTGTQFDNTPPLEDGLGEQVSGASDADIVISAPFRLGGYEFVQRWRFRDDGTILPSIRLGGVHNCELHTHQIYFRFNFELVDGGTGQSELVEECGPGGCPDTGSTGWAGVSCGCGVRPAATTSWRVKDSNISGRAIVVDTGPSDGDASNFCANTSDPLDCGSAGCSNTRDFCALPAAEPNETLTTDKCNDGLPSACGGGSSIGSDSAFWYIAHADNHNPCTYLPMCDPALGTVAFGPTIRLVGAW